MLPGAEDRDCCWMLEVSVDATPEDVPGESETRVVEESVVLSEAEKVVEDVDDTESRQHRY